LPEKSGKHSSMDDSRFQFSQSRAIFTEGVEDAAFLRALCREYDLKFDVRANIDSAGTPGITGFKRAIRASETVDGFFQVAHVVLIADNDQNATANFQVVASQIGTLEGPDPMERSWGVPTRVGVRADGDPSVSIWMWPKAGKVGCLETLIWEVLKAEHPKWSKCAETAYKCTKINRQQITHRDKALVRTFLAIACRKPLISTTQVWKDCPGLIPLRHNAFKPVSDFLRSI